jgi:hypothetical protein
MNGFQKQILMKKRIGKISMAIQDAVDKICEEENFEITYAEINAAMIETMKSYNGFELRELCKETNSL